MEFHVKSIDEKTIFCSTYAFNVPCNLLYIRKLKFYGRKSTFKSTKRSWLICIKLQWCIELEKCGNDDMNLGFRCKPVTFGLKYATTYRVRIHQKQKMLSNINIKSATRQRKSKCVIHGKRTMVALKSPCSTKPMTQRKDIHATGTLRKINQTNQERNCPV